MPLILHLIPAATRFWSNNLNGQTPSTHSSPICSCDFITRENNKCKFLTNCLLLFRLKAALKDLHFISQTLQVFWHTVVLTIDTFLFWIFIKYSSRTLQNEKIFNVTIMSKALCCQQLPCCFHWNGCFSDEHHDRSPEGHLHCYICRWHLKKFITRYFSLAITF